MKTHSGTLARYNATADIITSQAAFATRDAITERINTKNLSFIWVTSLFVVERTLHKCSVFSFGRITSV